MISSRCWLDSSFLLEFLVGSSLAGTETPRKNRNTLNTFEEYKGSVPLFVSEFLLRGNTTVLTIRIKSILEGIPRWANRIERLIPGSLLGNQHPFTKQLSLTNMPMSRLSLLANESSFLCFDSLPPYPDSLTPTTGSLKLEEARIPSRI